MMAEFVEVFHLSPEQFWKLTEDEAAAFARRLQARRK